MFSYKQYPCVPIASSISDLSVTSATANRTLQVSILPDPINDGRSQQHQHAVRLLYFIL